MSRQMRDFAQHFMQGMALGGQWAHQHEARQIERERNRLKDQQDKLRNAREERRLGIYEHGVLAQAESARANAFRKMNPIAKGGSGAAVDPQVEALHKRAAEAGIVAPPAPPPQQGQTVNNHYDTDGGGAEPVVAEPVWEQAKGGMVPKMAGGGFVDSFNAGLRSGASRSLKDTEKKKESGAGVTPGTIKKTGAVDVTVPSTLRTPEQETDYLVRGYAEGGAVPDDSQGFDYEKALNDLEAGLAQVQARPVAQPGYGGYDAGSANAATGNTSGSVGGGVGGESSSGAAVGGTGGVGGSASSDAGVGGSAAAGVGGDDGGTYQRGGRVRKFQSGGRVMEQAIDTGTSGPGSGYGYRAAPPARSYYG